MILATLLLAVLPQVSAATATPTPAPVSRPDPSTLGPQVGDRLPPFEVSDAEGRPRTLESLRGPKGLVLVIFRSADW